MDRRVNGEHADILFEPCQLGRMEAPNRIVRAATYEGLGDRQGAPRPELGTLYAELARGGVGTIITGFAFVAPDGRAMQPGQCGIHEDALVEPWRRVVELVRAVGRPVRLIMQLAHAGRQTLRRTTGLPVVGASRKRCSYFRQRVRALSITEVDGVVRQFGEAAVRAQQAGFDGVQIHGAHGYLVHQFLSPWTNQRKDRWGDRPLFLEEIVREFRRRCGEEFAVLVKLSGDEDRSPGVRVEDAVETAKRMEAASVDALEISYGTMEWALNIIRGAVPVDEVFAVNPLFKRVPRIIRGLWKSVRLESYLEQFIPFQENYNVAAAEKVKRAVDMAVIPVGGIRRLEGMKACITTHGLDAVSLCRPLICEPDLPEQMRMGKRTRTSCTSCNLCTVHADGEAPVHCYQKERESS